MFRIKKRWSFATFIVLGAIIATLFFYFVDVLEEEIVLPQETEGFHLREVSFNDLKGFNEDDVIEGAVAMAHSCEVLRKRPISYYAPAESWRKVCENFAKEDFHDSMAYRRFLKNNFKPYKVYFNGNSEGLFTGYYIPRLEASRNRSEEYNIPIYAPPRDIVYVNVEEFYPECKKCKIIGQVKGNHLKSYMERKEIDGKDLDAEVLVWLKDPVDNFILHIQGSGKVHFKDGTEKIIGYAGFNGHKFVGIGSMMIKEKLIPDGDYSMPSISKWLKRNPKKAQELMWKNPRYIFFRELDNHVVGGQGVPLTPKRSLAVDHNYISYGVPIWLNTYNAEKEEINRLMFAQDTGGAISGAIRGDFFWGEGDEAFMEAGRMKSLGEYYVLLPQQNDFTIKQEEERKAKGW